MSRFPVLLLLCATSLFVVSTAGQTPAGSSPISAPTEGRVSEWMSGEHIPAVSGKPFSAKVMLETTNQLVDGTLMTHTTYNLDARDSQGRTRNEGRNWIDPATGEEPRLVRIELFDPATNTRTSLFPLTKLARQWQPSTTNTAATTVKPETTRESLGEDTIEGLLAQGTRVTQVYPAGAMGNDRPLTIVMESWFSQDLKIALLTKRSDPRYGTQTVRVTELLRQDPDESLFAIPADYKVTNETPPGTATGAFSSTLARNKTVSAPAKFTTPPKCVYCPAPPFTDQARAAKFSGTIILNVTITADGNAQDVRVVRGAGMGLDENAVETVRTWRFQPAVGENGQAVAAIVPIEVTFRIAR